MLDDDDFESFERMVHEHWPTNIGERADLKKLHRMVGKIHSFITESINGESDCTILESMILMKWMQVVGMVNYERSNILLMGMLCDTRVEDIFGTTVSTDNDVPSDLHIDELSINFPEEVMQKITEGIDNGSLEGDFENLMDTVLGNSQLHTKMEEIISLMSQNKANTEEE